MIALSVLFAHSPGNKEGGLHPGPTTVGKPDLRTRTKRRSGEPGCTY